MTSNAKLNRIKDVVRRDLETRRAVQMANENIRSISEECGNEFFADNRDEEFISIEEYIMNIIGD